MRTSIFTAVLCFTVAVALSAQAPTYEKVGSAKQLMTALIIPASNALFEAGSKEPANDKDWDALRAQAVILSESANLLLMPGRVTASTSKGKAKAAPAGADWIKASRMMRASGKAALKAIDKKDLDALTGDVADGILMSCSTCHDKYLPK